MFYGHLRRREALQNFMTAWKTNGRKDRSRLGETVLNVLWQWHRGISDRIDQEQHEPRSLESHGCICHLAGHTMIMMKVIHLCFCCCCYSPIEQLLWPSRIRIVKKGTLSHFVDLTIVFSLIQAWLSLPWWTMNQMDRYVTCFRCCCVPYFTCRKRRRMSTRSWRRQIQQNSVSICWSSSFEWLYLPSFEYYFYDAVCQYLWFLSSF